VTIYSELGGFCLFLGLVCLGGVYRLLRAQLGSIPAPHGIDPLRRSLLLLGLSLGLVALGLGLFVGSQLKLLHLLSRQRSAVLAAQSLQPASAAVAADAAPDEPAGPQQDGSSAADPQYRISVQGGGALSLRASPDGKVIGSAPNGAPVIAVDPAPRTWNGRQWLHVRLADASGAEGWVAYDRLQPLR
jgi:hypothetical protein